MKSTRFCFAPMIALALISGLAAGCGFLDDEIEDRLPDDPFGPIIVGPNGPIRGQPLNASCTDTRRCRDGLACNDGTCEAVGESSAGTVCAISSECADGLVCDSIEARCKPSEGGDAGASCTSSVGCARGLRCNLIGFSGVCAEDTGSADVGASCVDDGECLSPLLCGEGDVCQLPAFGGIVPLDGAQCPNTQTASGAFRVLFEVPRDEPLDEFFALPFPNDVRLTDDGIDMSGFYNPGTRVIGGEFFDAFIREAGAGLNGFSPSPTAYLRLSRPYDLDAVTGQGDKPTLFYRNITPGSERYDESPQNWSWKLTTGRGNFICYNSVQVRAGWTEPLLEGETYAVWLTTAIGENETNETSSATLSQDADFAAMLAPQAPSDPTLARAWGRYEPFRTYLTAETIDPSTIAGAAVFTVGTPSQAVAPLRVAVARESGFALNDVTVCDGSTTSPCADGETRGCLNEETGYYEVHATYEAPVFQQGTRPYLRPADGGRVEVGTDGAAATNGTETMCLSMAIPRDATMPAGGWPVVMYAHGTGGSFTSHLRPTIAGALTDADADGEQRAFVTVGIDGVMHGPRRGDTELEPDVLFFNVLNPEASRANVLQGAADYFYLTRLLQNVSIPAAQSPTGAEVSFDAEALYFYGHSQGSNVGALFAAVEPGIQAAVLSGAGGSFVLSILNKTSPQDIPSMLPFVLGENGIDDRHPFLNLVQQWIDPADPLNYGRLIPAQSTADTLGRDVLQTYGVDDTYTPPEAMEALGGSARFGLLQPAIVPVGAMPSVAAPASGNKNGTTAVMVQYQPSGYDGHFVATRNADAVEDIVRFFVTNLVDGTATVK